MCEIMTIIAALVFSAIFFIQKKNNKPVKAVATTSLMFWAAAIMWFVDCVSSVIEGESFFDISLEDTLLGTIILVLGIAVFVVLSLVEKKKNVKTMAV